MNQNLIKQLQQTQITNENSLNIIGNLLIKAIEDTKNVDEKIIYMAVAWKYQVPQINQILQDNEI
jgi:hypothetical protein